MKDIKPRKAQFECSPSARMLLTRPVLQEFSHTQRAHISIHLSQDLWKGSKFSFLLWKEPPPHWLKPKNVLTQRTSLNDYQLNGLMNSAVVKSVHATKLYSYYKYLVWSRL